MSQKTTYVAMRKAPYSALLKSMPRSRSVSALRRAQRSPRHPLTVTLEVPAPPPPAPKGRHPLLGKTSATLGVMFLVLALPYTNRRLKRFRVAHAPWEAPESEAPQAL